MVCACCHFLFIPGDFEKAKLYNKRAEETSNLESDADRQAARKKIHTKRFDSGTEGMSSFLNFESNCSLP